MVKRKEGCVGENTSICDIQPEYEECQTGIEPKTQPKRSRRSKKAVDPPTSLRASARLQAKRQADELASSTERIIKESKMSIRARKQKLDAGQVKMEELEVFEEIERQHESAVHNLYLDFSLLKGIKLDPHLTRIIDLQHPIHFSNIYKIPGHVQITDTITDITSSTPITLPLSVESISIQIVMNANIPVYDQTIVNIESVLITIATIASGAAAPGRASVHYYLISRTTIPEASSETNAVIQNALQTHIANYGNKLDIQLNGDDNVIDEEYHDATSNFTYTSLSTFLQNEYAQGSGRHILLELVAALIRSKGLLPGIKANAFAATIAVPTMNASKDDWYKLMHTVQIASILDDIPIIPIAKSREIVENFYSKKNIDPWKAAFLSDEPDLTDIIELQNIQDPNRTKLIQALTQMLDGAPLFFDLLRVKEFNDILVHDLVVDYIFPNINELQRHMQRNLKIKFDRKPEDPLFIQLQPQPKTKTRSDRSKSSPAQIVAYTQMPIQNMFKLSRQQYTALTKPQSPSPTLPNLAPLPGSNNGLVQLTLSEILKIGALGIRTPWDSKYQPTSATSFSISLDFDDILALYPTPKALEDACNRLNAEAENPFDDEILQSFILKMSSVIEAGIALSDISDSIKAIMLGGGKRLKPKQARTMQEKFMHVRKRIAEMIQRVQEKAKQRIAARKKQPTAVRRAR